MAEIGDQDQPNQNSRSLLKVASAIGSGVGAGILLAQEEEKSKKKQEGEAQLQKIATEIDFVQRKWKELLSNPKRNLYEEQKLFGELFSLMSAAQQIINTTGISKSNPTYAAIISISQDTRNQIGQDMQRYSIQNGRFSTEFDQLIEYNGVLYSDPEQMEKVRQSDMRIAKIEHETAAIKASWDNLGKMETIHNKDSASALAPDQLYAELVKAEAILALRQTMLKALQEQREAAVKEVLNQAALHGLPAKDMEQLQEWISSIPEESRKNVSWLGKITTLIEYITKKDDDITACKATVKQSQENKQILETNSKDRGLPTAKATDVVKAAEELGKDAGVDMKLIKKTQETIQKAAVEKEKKEAVVEEKKAVKEEKSAVVAEKAAVEAEKNTAAKEEADTKYKNAAAVEENMAIAEEQKAVSQDAAWDMCLSISKQSGIDTDKYNTSEKFFAALQEKIASKPELMNDDNIAGIYGILQSEIREKQAASAIQPKTEEKNITAINTQIEGIPSPSAPPQAAIEEQKEGVPDLKKLSELAKVPSKAELENAQKDVPAEGEVKGRGGVGRG